MTAGYGTSEDVQRGLVYITLVRVEEACCLLDKCGASAISVNAPPSVRYPLGAVSMWHLQDIFGKYHHCSLISSCYLQLYLHSLRKSFKNHLIQWLVTVL